MTRPLPLSREEQFRLLEEGKVADAVRVYLGGDPARIGELFSISQDEYLAWVLRRPVREDGWLRTARSAQDGVYFINELPSLWTIYQQDRGAILWKKDFTGYEEARRYLELEFGLGRHLRRAA
jgi:hypothetical protein